MLQMLLAADERLEKSLVAPLQAKGWSVRVVRFLSEIPGACESEPLPEVIAATFPAAVGAHHALAELKREHGTRLPPIVAILPETRGSDADHLSGAGAAAVFAGPVRLNEFHAKTSSLAGAVRAERERIAEEARKLAERNSIPPQTALTQAAPEEQTLAPAEDSAQKRWRLWLIAGLVLLALLAALKLLGVFALFGAAVNSPASERGDGTAPAAQTAKPLPHR